MGEAGAGRPRPASRVSSYPNGLAAIVAICNTCPVRPLRPLSPREQRFVDEYLIDLKAAAAARRAGYSAGAAKSGSRILKRAPVAAAVSAALCARAERARVRADTVLGELARVAFFDPGALVDETGAIIPLNRLDPATRAGMGAFEIAEFEATARAPAGRRLRARPGEKVRALMALIKHLGIAAPPAPAPPAGQAPGEGGGESGAARARPPISALAAAGDMSGAIQIAAALSMAIRRRDIEARAAADAGQDAPAPPDGWNWIEAVLEEVRRRESVQTAYDRRVVEEARMRRRGEAGVWVRPEGEG